MSQPTKRYKQTINGSIGAGMKSVFGSSDRKYYILEHKMASKDFRAGENQEIIVDEVEIGRDPNCAVHIDGDGEIFRLVSRKHAAIVKDGDNWKLIHLSQTNTTYLNGNRVNKEWYLQNGDEIQLATGGPKLGFIIPSGKKSTVGSIGLTRRLSLFQKQALRPYKTALTLLSCFLLLIVMGGGYKLYDLNDKNKKMNEDTQNLITQIDDLKKKNDELVDAALKNQETIKNMDGQISNLKKENQKIRKEMKEMVITTEPGNDEINKCLPNVFYMQTQYYEITLPDGQAKQVNVGTGENELPGWSGTGFLLSDGKFVTARHVAEGWFYPISGGNVNKDLLTLNYIANNGGKVVVVLIAVSSSGTQFTFKSDQFTINRSTDKEAHDEEGHKFALATLDDSDYAYINIGKSGGLPFDKAKSCSLERGAKLTVLGFPLGHGVSSKKINPISGSAIVAAEGLERGVILTTDTNYEQGNSGGPVFYTDSSGKLVVVGIVSAGSGRTLGYVVPMSSVK